MSETKGRCRSEMTAAYGARGFKPNDSDLVTADALDRLAADVAVIEAKVNDIMPDDVRHFVESEKAWVKLVEDQRDAAVRERNEARALLELAQVQRTAAYADRDEARAEVYQLKCSRTETSKERDAAIRERDQWREEARLAVINRDEARAEVERLRAIVHSDAGHMAKILIENERLRAGPAAPQPAAVSDAQPAAWGLLRVGGRFVDSFVSKTQAAKKRLEWNANETWEHEIVPLYAAPQPAGQGISPKVADTQPTGNAAPAAVWLTDRERHVLASMLLERPVDLTLHWRDDVEPVIRSILSRAGSPPVVVLPTVFARSLLGDELVALQQVKDSLDKVGVAWREVPRE